MRSREQARYPLSVAVCSLLAPATLLEPVSPFCLHYDASANSPRRRWTAQLDVAPAALPGDCSRYVGFSSIGPFRGKLLSFAQNGQSRGRRCLGAGRVVVGAAICSGSPIRNRCGTARTRAFSAL